jgi:hypothetical protein
MLRNEKGYFMVKKSTKPKTKPKAKAKKPIIEVRLKKGYTEQDLLDKVPTIFKKLKTAHRSSDTALVEFHAFLIKRPV